MCQCYVLSFANSNLVVVVFLTFYSAFVHVSAVVVCCSYVFAFSRSNSNISFLVFRFDGRSRVLLFVDQRMVAWQCRMSFCLPCRFSKSILLYGEVDQCVFVLMHSLLQSANLLSSNCCRVAKFQHRLQTLWFDSGFQIQRRKASFTRVLLIAL